MTREQRYKQQMTDLGIYEEIFDPEIATLARIERELTRAMKAWSATAQPAGSPPSFTDPHYAVIQRLRAEALAHREALGLTPKALRKVRGAAAAAPDQQGQITEKLDEIVSRVSSYADLPGAKEAAAIGELLDSQTAEAVKEMMELV